MKTIRDFLDKYSFGMRTRKTALAVLICLALDYIINHHNPLNACIAAILTMQATQRESLSVGGQRLLGTALGGAIGILMLALATLFPQAWPQTAVRGGLAAVGLMVSISLCCILRKPDAAAIAAIMVLIISLEKNTDNTFLLALTQVVETAMGVLVAMGVNRFVARPKEAVKKSLQENTPAEDVFVGERTAKKGQEKKGERPTEGPQELEGKERTCLLCGEEPQDMEQQEQGAPKPSPQKAPGAGAGNRAKNAKPRRKSRKTSKA